MLRNIEPQLINLLSQNRKIVITTHKNPDGDAIGSSLGLANWLIQYGHKVDVITPNGYPEFLQWMKGNGNVVKYNTNSEKAKELIDDAEIIFCLDFNTLTRIGDVGDLVNGAECYKVLIDHHPQPESFANSTYWDTSASSTAQLVFDFIEELNGLDKLDGDASSCLYAGIMTDSGSFRFPSTSARTHQIVATLIEKGTDPSDVYDKVNNTFSEGRLRLLGYCIYEKMKVFPKYKTAYIALSQEELKKFNFQKGDTEGVVNYPLSLANVRFSILITEQDNEVKLSLRSIGNFSVNDFARKYFNGGGHVNAAGGRSDVPFAETVKKLEDLLPEYKAALNEE